jgi:hypothetical protein
VYDGVVAVRVRKRSNADPGGNTKQEKEHNGMINVSVFPGAVYLCFSDLVFIYLFILSFLCIYLYVCTGNVLENIWRWWHTLSLIGMYDPS